MQVAIGVFLVALGATFLWGGYQLFRRLMTKAGELSEPVPEPVLEEVEVSGDVLADGLVLLFADHFVEPKRIGPATLPRDRAYSPLTDQELDPEDWAVQILYASLAELHREACVDFRVEERAPSYLPPFPQKRWELGVIQRTPFPTSPVCGALEAGFDLMRRRKQQRVAQGKEEPGEVWCALDEIIERALRAMRQEITFWERSGVYGDLRNYVASALVAQGFLVQPGRETWIDRRNSRRPKPNPEAVQTLEEAREELRQRLGQYRQQHGSAHARGEAEPEEGKPQVRNTDPSLVTREEALEDMPLDDCLRLSIYEALVSLKQLEPSGDAGV
jgi:hypothetical protein